jgi:hypothetical protein
LTGLQDVKKDYEKSCQSKRGIITCVRLKMLHSELTEKIIVRVFAVYNEMGYGYLESVNIG